jgi:NAD(P)-dependent dehydrogenase (short-subunit alcohol dehydrogenase family)
VHARVLSTIVQDSGDRRAYRPTLMDGSGLAVFDTAIGACGIAWSSRGIRGLQLPERDARATRTRLFVRHCELRFAPPSSPVGAVIERIITGATSGIGARTARLFVDEGARVVLVGRREHAGRELSDALGPRAVFFRADVAVEDDVAACVEAAVERFGRIDCLVNNAGTPAPSRGVTSIDLDGFEAALRVHVGGVLAGMKHAGAVMVEQESGCIVNTASINGSRAGLTGLAYSTAKAAVIHATRCAAVELGQRGVRVNSVSPGPVMTGIFAKGFGVDGDTADGGVERTRSAFRRILPAWQPLSKLAEPDDVAQTIAFLASDAARMVNGHDLVVDGGITAGRPASVMASEAHVLACAARQP